MAFEKSCVHRSIKLPFRVDIFFCAIVASSCLAVVPPAMAQSAGFSQFPVMQKPIRVGLSVDVSQTEFAIWAPGYVFMDDRPVFELKPQTVYSFNGSGIHEVSTGRSYSVPGDKKVYVTAQDYRVWEDGHWYRGCLELVNLGSSVRVINLLDIEDYLYGVVPSEMPSHWHLEALKAQAVAARSYAFAHMGKKSKWRSKGFDVVPDVRDQAYNGIGSEARSSQLAVHDTRGLVLKDSGKVKPGYFRAWVGDAFENLNLRYSTVTKSALEQATGVPNIQGVGIKQWDTNGNAIVLQIMGAGTSRDIDGRELAKSLGFTTAGILDAHHNGDSWQFTVRGPGNGTRGLSQHGADMLASKGWRFDQILQQYYEDNDGKLRLDYITPGAAPPPVVATPLPAQPTAQPTAPQRPPQTAQTSSTPAQTSGMPASEDVEPKTKTIQYRDE